MSFFMRPSRSTYVLQNGAKSFMKSHLNFVAPTILRDIFSKTYFISILDSHVILWNSKQISMRFHKEFDIIVQLFEFNPLSKCANKAVYQICLFWNWTEWEQCTNSKSPVEWYAIFYSNTCLICFFWIEKKGY